MASTPAAAVTGRLRGERKAQREDEGQDQLNKRFAIAEQLEGGGLIVEIEGEGAVLAFGFVSLWHVSSPFVWRWVRMRHRACTMLKDQSDCERIGASPLNSLEGGCMNSLRQSNGKRRPLSFLTDNGELARVSRYDFLHNV
jgi:hypothetical protein